MGVGDYFLHVDPSNSENSIGKAYSTFTKSILTSHQNVLWFANVVRFGQIDASTTCH